MPALDVEERRWRVLTAGESLAHAYARTLSEGDGARASVILGAFQAWWNEYHGTYMDRWRAAYGPDGADEIPQYLPPTGALAEQSQLAIVYALTAFESSGSTNMAWGAPALIGWYRGRTWPASNAAVWDAYNIARGASLVAAGTSVRTWAEDFIDGVDGDFGGLIAELTSSNAASGSSGGGGVPTGTDEVYELPELPVGGLVPRRAAKSYWPWAVAGGAAAVLGGVLVYRMRKGRR